MAEETLEVLAARSTQGEGAALSELCRRLEAPVFRLCARMLGDVREAEDAAQDILVKVVTNLGRFEGRSALSTWVHQIAVRHVFALTKSRAEQRSLDEDAFSELLEQGLAFGATQPKPSAEDRVLLAEVRLACTQGMLLMLSREERLALVLVELLGFDAAEAAEIGETSHEAMRQRLSRARVKLGSFLQAKCGVVNPSASCHCEHQIPAKKALGLSATKQRWASLSESDVQPPAVDTVAAAGELKALRSVSVAFREGGKLAAPASLRARMEQVMPTVLGR